MPTPPNRMTEADPTSSRRARYGYPLAFLVLVVSLVLVVVAWQHARQRELRLASEQFRNGAGQQAALVQLHLNNIEVTLRGGASLFAAVDHPTPEQWRGYVDGLRLPTAFTSHFGHWHYLPEQAPLPQSQRVLRQLLDLRTPLSLTPDDCRLIGQIVQVAATAAAAHPPGG